MNIILMRHIETSDNLAGVLSGRSSDVSISNSNLKNLELFARELNTKKINIVNIYSSPAKRAVESANILKKIFNIDIIINDDLIERDYGKFEGLTRKALIKKRERLKLKNFDPTQDWKNVLEVEQDIDIWFRVHKILREATPMQENDYSIVVTHAGVIKAILHTIVKSSSQYSCFKIKNSTFVFLKKHFDTFEIRGIIDPNFLKDNNGT